VDVAAQIDHVVDLVAVTAATSTTEPTTTTTNTPQCVCWAGGQRFGL